MHFAQIFFIVDFLVAIRQIHPMTREEQIKEDLERIEKINLWSIRIKKLSTRKREPLSEAMFCAKHGFSKSHFNRIKNGKVFPRQIFFDSVEKALVLERV